MFRVTLIISIGLGVLLCEAINLDLWGAPSDPARAVVKVVCLDKQGNPKRQGLGVVVGRDGRILTSASLFIPGGTSVVLIQQEAKYLVQDVLYRDELQGLAVIKVEADRLPKVNVGSVKRVHPGESVRLGIYSKNGVILKETQVAKVFPFSSRLILIKLNPPFSEAEPGAPLLDSRGDLVGMVHAFAGEKGNGGGVKVILACGRDFLPQEVWLKSEEKSLKQEKDGEKISYYPKALLSFPNSPLHNHHPVQTGDEAQGKRPEDQGEKAYMAFWQGVRASQDLKWEVAQEMFTAALAVSGELPEAYFGRGVARYHLENYEGAVQDCQQATNHLPGYALASLWLGKAWERLGNRFQAQQAYQRAVDQAPDLDEAWFALGVLAYHEGQLVQAQKYLRRAGDKVEERARRAFYLGAIARSQGRLEQAQQAFSEAINQDPDLLLAYLEGGKTFLELGRPQKASQLLTELIRRDPELNKARYYLALAHLAAWNIREAWEQYFVLQELDPALASRLLPFLEN